MAERILVVDDEPSLVASLSYSLGRAGFQVRIATDGPGALAVAQEVDPDLIVPEVMLPGLDGIEVCRRLRTVDVHVRRLRRHLETDPEKPRFLETVRGVGYVLRRRAGGGSGDG